MMPFGSAPITNPILGWWWCVGATGGREAAL